MRGLPVRARPRAAPFLIAALLALAAPAAAQHSGAGDPAPPRVFFSGTTSFTGGTAPSPSVEVRICEETALNPSSLTITHNGANVKPRFAQQGTAASECTEQENMVLQGQIGPLPEGTSTLQVHVCDQGIGVDGSTYTPNCATVTRTFTWTSSAPRVVSIVPLQSSQDAVNVPLTVTWGAGGQPLNPGSATIRLNGIVTAGTAGFVYTSTSSTTATSTGTIQLVPGWNRVHASICDNVGTCSPTDSIRLYRGSNAPVISVSPAGTRQPGEYLGATVSIQVPATQLSRSSVSFTVNGARDSTTFALASTPTPPSGGDRQDYAGTLKLPLGETVLSVRACTTYGSSCTVQEARFFRYTTYHAAPVVTLAYDPDRHTPSPTEVSLSASGPVYRARDVDRALTFVYNGGSVDPAGVVELDVADFSQDSARAVSIRLYDATGARVPLTNQTDENVYRAGSGTTRVAARFAARSLATGAYSYTAEVTSHFADGSTLSTTLPVRVVIVNERSSRHHFFPGWTMLGLQHLNQQANGGVVITEGDGSASYYALASCRDANGGPVSSPQDAAAAICAFTSPKGGFETLTYHRGWGYDRRFPDGSSVTFHANGYLAFALDRFARTTTYNWSDGWLQSVVDDAGQTNLITYNNGALFGIRVAGQANWFDYSGTVPNDPTSLFRGVVTSVGEVKRTLIYETDANGQVARWQTGASVASGDWYVPVSGANRQTLEVRSPLVTAGGTQQRQTVQVRSAAAQVLPAGATSVAAPAPRVRPSEVWMRATAANGDSVRVQLDRWGLPVRTMDSRGKVSVTVRDSLLRPVLEATATGDTTRYSWDGYRLTKVVGSSGDSTQLFYQDQRFPTLPTTIYNPDNTITFNSYGARGQLDSTRVGDPESRTRITYDALVRPLRVVNVRYPSRDSVVTTYTYHATGMQNLATISNAAGTTSYTYDVRGRPSAVRNALGNRDSTVYDLNGRVKATLDGLSYRSAYTYMNEDAAWAYHGSLLASFTDPGTAQHGFARNLLGWVTEQTDPRGQIRRFTYGIDGQPTQVQNRDGSIVSLAYDSRGRVERRVAGNTVTKYEYDDDGRWMIVKHAVGADTVSKDTLRYDAQGRLTSETTVRGTRAWRIESQYDAAGNRTYVSSRRLDTGEAERVVARYTYQGGVLVKVESGNLESADPNSVVRLAYDGRYARTITYPGGVIGTFTYSSIGALRGIAYTGSSSSITAINRAAGESYGYDGAGRLRSRQNNGADSVRSVQYHANGWLNGYGAASTVTQPCHPAQDPALGLVCPSPSGWWRNYGYDAGGTRTDQSSIRDTGNRLLVIGSYRYWFNAEGQVIRRFTEPNTMDQALWWTPLGQLDSIYNGGIIDGQPASGSVTRYTYDGLGRRIRKRHPNGQVVEYVYDGSDIALELDGAGNIVARYSSLPGVDATLSMERGGQRYYYLRDYLGSVSALVNTSGALVNRYRYDPWGAAEVVQEGVEQPYRYTGREYDKESGLYYYRARHYDAIAGRFISEDPIGLEGGANVFAYAGNDPVNSVDPFGLEPCPPGQVKSADGKCAVPLRTLPVVAPRWPTAWERMLANPYQSDRGGSSFHFRNECGSVSVARLDSGCRDAQHLEQALALREWEAQCGNTLLCGQPLLDPCSSAQVSLLFSIVGDMFLAGGVYRGAAAGSKLTVGGEVAKTIGGRAVIHRAVREGSSVGTLVADITPVLGTFRGMDRMGSACHGQLRSESQIRSDASRGR